MELVTEMEFSPDLKIVNAVRSRSSNLGCMVTSVLVMVLLIFWVYTILVKGWQTGGFWLWAAVIFMGFMVVLLFFTGIDSWLGVEDGKRLKRYGVTVPASIVGREVTERYESSNLYSIYYQFQPDFVVKYDDTTNNQTYYRMPLGHKLLVRYLPENPEINGPGFDK